jgi:ATP-binding cassette subfamily B (MDR/TAP) protein 1
MTTPNDTSMKSTADVSVDIAEGNTNIVLEEAVHEAKEIQLEDPRDPKPRSTIRISQFIGVEWIWVFLGMFFAAGQGVIPLVFFWTLGNSFGDLATATSDQVASITAQMGLNITYIAIGALVASFLANFFFAYGSQRIGRNLRQAYFTKLTQQEIGFFDIKKAGALMHALSDDAAKATDVFAVHLLTLTQNATQCIVGFAMAVASNYAMALLEVSSIPLMIFIQLMARPILMRVATRIALLTSGSVSIANEVITSMRTVRSMAGEEKEFVRYSDQLKKVSFMGVINALTIGTMILITHFIIFGALGMGIWFGGRLLNSGTIDIGIYIKTVGLGIMTVLGMIFTLILIPEVIKSQASMKALLHVLLREPAMRYRGGKTIDQIKGHISIKNVTFRYPARPKVAVLKNFNLEIQPGTSVALVGQSGSGKSTIIGLLEKWYEPEEGTVDIDGVSVVDLDPVWLHRHIGIVSQEPSLFATSIRRNITYAIDTINGHITSAAQKENPNITEEDLEKLLIPVNEEVIQAAAKSANAHDFIIKLPDGYDTIIGERGVSLSGGQKQRIAIARAVLQDPKILLLDEATSALDTKSEALVQDALEKLMQSRTSIVIAHRLTTIQDCNNIVVMRQGVVVEMGKHDDLILNTTGAYYSLAARQMKLGKSASSESLVSADDSSSDTEDAITSHSTDTIENQETLPIVAETISTVNDSNNIANGQEKQSKKKNKRRNKKGVAEFTNERDIEDPRKPVRAVRNPFLFFKLIGPETFIWLLGLLGAFLSGTAPIFNYLFLGNVVTAATPRRNADGSLIPFPPGYSIADIAAQQGSYVAIVAAGTAVAMFVNWFFTMLAYDRIGVRMKRLFFSSLIKQEMGFFDIKKSGKLLSTIGEDIGSAVDGITLKGALFAQHMGQFVIGIIMALISSWQTALIMLAAGAPSIAIVILSTSIVINYFNKKIMHLSASALATANEVIGSIRTVRSMAGEEREQRRFRNDMDKMVRASLGKALATAIMAGGMQFVVWGVAGLCFYYGGTLVANGTLAPGSLLQVFGNMIFAALGASLALGEVQHFLKSMLATKEVQYVTERVPAINPHGGENLEKITGNIEFRNISFAYPSRPNTIVMKNFNLTIKPGQHVALVGESGCGKSTIVGLIERFYDPLEGQVLLDGVDMKNLDVQWLHKSLASVTQEPTLFATTIRKNITYAVGDENVTMDQVIECAKNANCHDFITTLPNGYDTVVGERGVSMSGGQKQRIAIARAMIQNAPLLLLDEATSALDTEAESLVQAALDRLMVGKTTIVIAHRLSTVKDCDLIVAMRAGEVQEMGTHDELVSRQGMYYKLAQKQMEFGQAKRQNNVQITEDD